VLMDTDLCRSSDKYTSIFLREKSEERREGSTNKKATVEISATAKIHKTTLTTALK